MQFFSIICFVFVCIVFYYVMFYKSSILHRTGQAHHMKIVWLSADIGKLLLPSLSVSNFFYTNSEYDAKNVYAWFNLCPIQHHWHVF